MSEANPNRSLFDRAYALLLWLLLGAFLVYGLGVLHHAGRLLSYPFSVDYVEWPKSPEHGIWFKDNRFTHLGMFAVERSQLHPDFTLINAMGVSVTGPTPFFGRLLALLSTFGIASVLVALLYPHTKGRFSIALLAGALFATSHMVWLWSGIVRVDNLAIFLSLLGLLAYSTGSRILACRFLRSCSVC